MNIKAVIFDLDGTLFDSIKDIADSNNAMLRDFGFPEHTSENYVQWIGNGAMRLVKLSLPRNANFSDNGLKTYLARYEHYYTQNIVAKSSAYKGINAVLDYLTDHNIPVAINTNKPQHLTDLVVQKYFAKWPFNKIIGQGKQFAKKPDPSGALYIANEIGIAPEQILFVGDSLIDINTAKNAGMIPLGVTWGYGDVNLSIKNVKVVEKASQIIDFIKAE